MGDFVVWKLFHNNKFEIGNHSAIISKKDYGKKII